MGPPSGSPVIGRSIAMEVGVLSQSSRSTTTSQPSSVPKKPCFAAANSVILPFARVRWVSGNGILLPELWNGPKPFEHMMRMPPGSFEKTYQAFLNIVHPDDRSHLTERIAQAFSAD